MCEGYFSWVYLSVCTLHISPLECLFVLKTISHGVDYFFLCGATALQSRRRRLEFCEFLLVMPPTKVCPECGTVVPIKLKVCKSCQHVLWAKWKTEQNLAGKGKDKLWKVCKWAAESSEQTMHRWQQNKEHMASMRAAESNELTLHRQQHDREYKASVRAAESSEQTLHRQQHDREYKASVRAAKKANDVSIEQGIVSFHSDIKQEWAWFHLHLLPSFDVQKECCSSLVPRPSLLTRNVTFEPLEK